MSVHNDINTTIEHAEPALEGYSGLHPDNAGTKSYI